MIFAMTGQNHSARRINMLAWCYSTESNTSWWGHCGGYYSEDRKHRWTYCRRWEEGDKIVCWIGLNPGKSDEKKLPYRRPTVQKIFDLSRLWGMNGLIFVNLFAWRATKPQELKKAAARGVDIVGHLNDRAIKAAVRESSLTIAAWGKLGKLQNRGQHVAEMLQDAKCLRLTKHNHPWHPLFAKSVKCPSDLVKFAVAGKIVTTV